MTTLPKNVEMGKRTAAQGLAVLLALAQVTCHQVIMTAPPGSSLTLFANPNFIPANGGVAIISALVTEPAGTPVPDGTVVQFFTNLGRIDEQGKTNDGVARVNLVSDSRSGTATVTAFSGGASAAPAPAPSPSASPGTGTASGAATGTVQVVIGSALPAIVLVTAFPNTLPANGQRYATIRAFVLDANGNPVPNVPVLFAITQGANPSGDPDIMESRGTPVFTDNNGVAEDTLLVRTPHTAAQKTLTITATTANGKTGTVSVLIN